MICSWYSCMYKIIYLGNSKMAAILLVMMAAITKIHIFGRILVKKYVIDSSKVSKSTFSGSRNTMGALYFLPNAYIVWYDGSHYQNSQILPYLHKY